jgi:hypothetical protein
MYSSLCVGVKQAAAALVLLPVLARGAQSPEVCDPGLTALWTPAHPQLGRYEVCVSARLLADIAAPGWKIETAAPLDALGTAGSFDKAAVARLYGGRWPSVARGWSSQNGRFQAITLVSPYPNRQLTALEPGTLIIRYFVIE